MPENDNKINPAAGLTDELDEPIEPSREEPAREESLREEAPAPIEPSEPEAPAPTEPAMIGSEPDFDEDSSLEDTTDTTSALSRLSSNTPLILGIIIGLVGVVFGIIGMTGQPACEECEECEECTECICEECEECEEDSPEYNYGDTAESTARAYREVLDILSQSTKDESTNIAIGVHSIDIHDGEDGESEILSFITEPITSGGHGAVYIFYYRKKSDAKWTRVGGGDHAFFCENESDDMIAAFGGKDKLPCIPSDRPVPAE